MTTELSPFELLKTYPGLIHRQPVFMTHRLDVDSYHFSFLDHSGTRLPDDAEVPDFLAQLGDILPTVSEHRKVMLSMPSSWREAIVDNAPSTLQYNFVLDSDAAPIVSDNARFQYARHADDGADGNQDELLLVDLQQNKSDELEQNMPSWQQQHRQICAIGVHEQSDYDLCQSHQVELCQGHFYTLPAISDRKKISPSLQTLTELLVKLQNPEIEAEELAATVNQDVALSYKLLRLINSAFFGLPREVSSTQQAVVMLGQNKIKTWASLLCLSGIDDKPVELRVVAMTRARMCELLAGYYKGQPDLFFAAGLFSTLDALMDSPLDTLIEKLPLSQELKDALLKHEGAAGLALQDALHYEHGQWEAICASAVPNETLATIYLDAIQWSKALNAQLSS